MDQLEGGQVLWMVRQTNEGSRPEQLKHLASLPVMGAAGTGLGLRCYLERTGGSRKCHREADGREGDHFQVIATKAPISLEFVPFLALNP